MTDKRPLIIGTLGLLGAGAVAYKLLKPKPPVASLSPTPNPQILPLVEVAPIIVQPSVDYLNQLPDATIFPFARLQSAVVPPKSSVTVFLGQFPSSYAAVIQYVGNTYFLATDNNGNSALTLNWMLDGDLVEAVQRIIADINSPKHISPPLMATREIRWVAVNTHPTQSAYVQILMDGYLKRRRAR